MVTNISKHSIGSFNNSGCLAKSVFSYGFLTIRYSGSGLFVNTFNDGNGYAATESSPIYKSDISEQF
ncbi:unnamed protein product [Adineta steineri]|uniref:Uncharacterized protein n=1 Tax=Adineta steineri TaxID=433720 RepID=A0A813YL06_9BILA|nr:unnamed protein product [Adineta steineri]CAF1022873.1 unnamed protein product [Adineta steineri]CAF1158674.1 unnamed protein product [Adineta steineri]